MKIEVNLEKRYFFILLGVIILIGSIIAVYATHVPSTKNPSHDINDVVNTPTCTSGQALTHTNLGWSCVDASEAAPTITTYESAVQGATILGKHKFCYSTGQSFKDASYNGNLLCHIYKTFVPPFDQWYLEANVGSDKLICYVACND